MARDFIRPFYNLSMMSTMRHVEVDICAMHLP
jgi:hypothetical protein